LHRSYPRKHPENAHHLVLMTGVVEILGTWTGVSTWSHLGLLAAQLTSHLEAGTHKCLTSVQHSGEGATVVNVAAIFAFRVASHPGSTVVPVNAWEWSWSGSAYVSRIFQWLIATVSHCHPQWLPLAQLSYPSIIFLPWRHMSCWVRGFRITQIHTHWKCYSTCVPQVGEAHLNLWWIHSVQFHWQHREPGHFSSWLPVHQLERSSLLSPLLSYCNCLLAPLQQVFLHVIFPHSCCHYFVWCPLLENKSSFIVLMPFNVVTDIWVLLFVQHME